MGKFLELLEKIFGSGQNESNQKQNININISGNGDKHRSSPGGTRRNPGRASSPATPPRPATIADVKLIRARLYTVGAKGRVYTDKFYRSLNNSFGIEYVLKNLSGRRQRVHMGLRIYDEGGNAKFRHDEDISLDPYETKGPNDLFVSRSDFAKIMDGSYKAQLWLDDKRVYKEWFKVVR